jgi:16S rRNA A1518/A1519 N6-dimethyltransferase RsmA/KsgA/DIM1 with predicted DNA glycosylase/AP lyase activity
MEQHFLTSPAKLRALVQAADIAPTDRVLELGSGGGTVAAVLPLCRLTLVELDARLAEGLRGRFPRATVVQDDALAVLGRLEFDVLLANLPHTLTGAVLTRLSVKTFRRAVLAVHEADDLTQLTASAGGHLRLTLLVTLVESDFIPPQLFRSKLVLAVLKPTAQVSKTD